MKPAAQDDVGIIEAIALRQDERALGELYDRYSRLVFSICLQLLQDRRLAEEATLDVFTQVWQKASTYKPARASVKTWIASMARYKSIDMLRRQNSRPEADSIELNELQLPLESTGDNPEQATERSLQAQHVRAALAELPPEQLEVIRRAYYLGQTQRRIAQELELPLGTVKTRVRLAMEKLRRSLSQDMIDPKSTSVRINT